MHRPCTREAGGAPELQPNVELLAAQTQVREPQEQEAKEDMKGTSLSHALTFLLTKSATWIGQLKSVGFLLRSVPGGTESRLGWSSQLSVQQMKASTVALYMAGQPFWLAIAHVQGGAFDPQSHYAMVLPFDLQTSRCNAKAKAKPI